MMTRTEYLLWLLAEECAEVAQRASKAARFGLGEIQDGQSCSNSLRLLGEITDLMGVIAALQDECVVGPIPDAGVDSKREKIDMYMEYSRQLGILE